MSEFDTSTPLSPPSTPHITLSNLPKVPDRPSERDGIRKSSERPAADCMATIAPNPEPPALCPPTWEDGERDLPVLVPSGAGRQQPHTPERSAESSPDPLSDNFGSIKEPGFTTDRPRLQTSRFALISLSKTSTLQSSIHSKVEELQDLNGLDIMADDEIEVEDEVYTTQTPMTAAERRAAKRKMKRFRLTRDQARFLMSEFTRQAHPDAAHRERLASEIPGLSPRQVQVWFQNRRAKLKRLTIDDRERVMRSRALPDNFDSAQALHSPFSPSTHTRNLPPTSHTVLMVGAPDERHNRPHSYDHLQWQYCSAQESFTSITPAFGSFNLTPPQSMTETPSPISSIELGLQLDCSPIEHGSVDGPSSFAFMDTCGAPSVPLLQASCRHLQERFGRQRAESLCSPLRTSVSCSSPGLPVSPVRSAHDAYSASFGVLLGAQGPDTPPDCGNAGQYGLDYPHSSIKGFQAASRMRSCSTKFPRRIDLEKLRRAHLSLSGHSLRTPHSLATLPNYDHSVVPAGASHDRQGLCSAPHHTSAFADPYEPHGSVTNYGFEHITSHGLGIHTDTQWRRWD